MSHLMTVGLLNVFDFRVGKSYWYNMDNMALNYLTEKAIDFSKCRGQSYDKSTNWEI